MIIHFMQEYRKWCMNIYNNYAKDNFLHLAIQSMSLAWNRILGLLNRDYSWHWRGSCSQKTTNENPCLKHFVWPGLDWEKERLRVHIDTTTKVIVWKVTKRSKIKGKRDKDHNNTINNTFINDDRILIISWMTGAFKLGHSRILQMNAYDL